MKKLIFIIILGVVAACSNSETTDPNAETKVLNSVTLNDAQFESAKIATGKLEEKLISSTIKVNGKIDVPPQNLVSVSVPLGGYLESTKLLPGMHLNKGEVIAVLQDQQYIQLQQDYLITKSKLELAELDFKRQKDLNQSKASSDKSFQQARSEYQSMKITLSALAEKLRLININPNTLNENNLSKNIRLTAPFDGFVSKVNFNIGKYVNPTDVLFELVDPRDIHLNLKVFEKDLIQLTVGQKLYAYSNSQPDKKFKCEIILISQDITSDRTAEVHCHFEKYDKTLLPGMYMNAEIELKNQLSLAVEEKSVVNFEGANYLFIKTAKNTFEMREVKLGNSENGWVEVVNKEKFNNQQIVTDGAYSLLMTLKNESEE